MDVDRSTHRFGYLQDMVKCESARILSLDHCVDSEVWTNRSIDNVLFLVPLKASLSSIGDV